ncbi:hypothetical protein HDU87_003087 [Geranomyces variabilis]|uniref:C2H2-type domain-containing protein n=1 Tax=Geranomyces variabilis TaxID=109894 RepID=A0AAD5XQU7_9FUNG|nr:hypothetical protein HDU87_003087 [Geranomyces variabilis]
MALPPPPPPSTRSILLLIDPTHIAPTAQLHKPLTTLLACTNLHTTLRLAHTSSSPPPAWLPTTAHAVQTSSSPPTRLAADLALHFADTTTTTHHAAHRRTDVLILYGRDESSAVEQRCEELRVLAKELGGVRRALRIDLGGVMQVARFAHAVDAMCAHAMTRTTPRARREVMKVKVAEKADLEDKVLLPGLADWTELALPGLEAISSDEEEEGESDDKDSDAEYAYAEDIPWEELEAMVEMTRQSATFTPPALDKAAAQAAPQSAPLLPPRLAPEQPTHKTAATNAKTYTCLECGRVFGNARSLSGHKGWHTRTRNAAAAAAGTQNSSRALTPQLSVPQPQPPMPRRRLPQQPAQTPAPAPAITHTCLECGKVFSSARSLGGHKGWHTRAKNAAVAAIARR